MMSATVVAIIGLGSLSVAHLGVRSAQNTRDAESAAQLARTAVELGVRQINANPFWRYLVLNNLDYSPWGHSLNGGTISYRYVDPDGDFLNNSADGIRVYGTGRCGAATYVESVLLQPTGDGVSCLEAALHCRSHLNLQNYCNIVTPHFLSVDGSITASATQCEIAGRVEATGSVNGNITGTRSAFVSARQMPGNTAFEYYRANGTAIDIGTIPLSSNVRVVSNRLFAPRLNPFGAAGNAEGIYVIDCQGQNLRIEHSRVLGTLVILNPGTICCFQGSVAHAPVSPNFPAILVQGDAQFDTAWDPLSEAGRGTNFNPVDAPFENSTDVDTVDQYAAVIKGLTYVSGKLTIKANLAAECAFDGSVVCGSIELENTGDARFSYRPTHFDFPPPGFATGNKLQVVPGTWERAALP
jgi:hypothetical protein